MCSQSGNLTSKIIKLWSSRLQLCYQLNSRDNLSLTLTINRRITCPPLIETKCQKYFPTILLPNNSLWVTFRTYNSRLVTLNKRGREDSSRQSLFNNRTPFKRMTKSAIWSVWFLKHPQRVKWYEEVRCKMSKSQLRSSSKTRCFLPQSIIHKTRSPKKPC